MEQMIFAVITIFFALVGVVDFCVGVQRWLRCTGELAPALLVVEILPREESAEARLAQAADLLGQGTALRGVRLVVLCAGGGENVTICQKFCGDRGIPLVRGWEEIPLFSPNSKISGDYSTETPRSY